MLVDVQRKSLISGEIEEKFSKGKDQIIFPNSIRGGAVTGFRALRTRVPASFPPDPEPSSAVPPSSLEHGSLGACLLITIPRVSRRGPASPSPFLASPSRGPPSTSLFLGFPPSSLASPRPGPPSPPPALGSPSPSLASPRRGPQSPLPALGSPPRSLTSPKRGPSSPSPFLESPHDPSSPRAADRRPRRRSSRPGHDPSSPRGTDRHPHDHPSCPRLSPSRPREWTAGLLAILRVQFGKIFWTGFDDAQSSDLLWMERLTTRWRQALIWRACALRGSLPSSQRAMEAPLAIGPAAGPEERNRANAQTLNRSCAAEDGASEQGARRQQ
jgi:hypothetical protein